MGYPPFGQVFNAGKINSLLQQRPSKLCVLWYPNLNTTNVDEITQNANKIRHAPFSTLGLLHIIVYSHFVRTRA